MKRIVHFFKRYSYLFFFISITTAQTDSLEQKLMTGSKAEKIEIYKQLVSTYGKTEIEKALDYAKQGLELVKDDYTKDTSFFYLRMGNFYNAKSEHEKALFYNKKLLEVVKKLEYELGIAKSYQNIGVTYVKMGDYNQALDYYLKALKIYETLEEENFVVGITGNIGSLYSCRLKDDENGLVYYNKALTLSKKNGNEEFRAHILGAVGEMYMRQKEFEKAKNILKESIVVAEKTNYTEVVISGYNNLSQINIEEKNFIEALEYTKKALQIRFERGSSEDITLAYLTLGDIYDKLGNTKTAISYYDKALLAATETKALPQLSRVYQALHEYSSKKKEYKKSYEYLLKYNAVKDSLFSKEKHKLLREIQAKFDLENKEKEVEILTKENKIKVLENENHRTTQIVLITGLVTLIIVLVTLLYAYKNKQKTNRILAEKNSKISQTLKDREILLKEVHHRVKNNLQIVSSLLSLQHKFSEHKSATEILQEIQNKIQAMAIIHEKLYKSSDLSLINLQTYLDGLLTHFKTSYHLSERNITINGTIEEINLDMDYLVPCGLIINEIIANSIKHAFRDNQGGQISIEASRNKDQCILTIKDTGVGFPEDFEIENSRSLGMKLIQGLTQQINGSIHIASNPGACYTITFSIAT
ncbi:two-component sensor histidine kinase [Aquimarina sp. MAR_2010_214]|uniref:tetratricopeptide repeat-containing sensor histidine kinase n=1 Tax=Aquimarina sp. MAR_2010_214 TaxID=1250026 RepID=UPI000C700E65|nr:tetratricopeptide repeat protein [Aquimarina sp. MAR_2010_214]PKV49312.1 two-component sensor histidine kinase [Aquimarina sp. MAR_2010_214]